MAAAGRAPVIGARVLARREPDLPPEPAVIKQRAANDASATVRFGDGFLLASVPLAELVVPCEESTDDIVASAHEAAMAHLRGVPFDDGEYDGAVRPTLPAVPDEPTGIAKYTFIAAYKDAGNALFKAGDFAPALRTYLVGVTLLQRLGYDDDVGHLLVDLEAHGACVACFSNAALCALKLERHELANWLCDKGLAFGPCGAELAKLLLRKAQATLDAPRGADPDAAVALLERANATTPASRPVLEVLQRAKRAAKERQKMADRALFAGKGFGARARLAGGAAARADSHAECDALMRRGWALYFGTGAERDHVAPEHREMLGQPKPERDAAAARALFAEAAAIAAAAALPADVAHARFGEGSASAELEEWEAAVAAFEAYFALQQRIAAHARGGGGGGGGDDVVWHEPLLGEAHARFYCGMSLYHLRRAEAAVAHLNAYLQAVATFVERTIRTRDAWGNEVLTDLDREVARQRQWVVCGRCEYTVRRMLASLSEHAAAIAAQRAADAAGSDEGAGQSHAPVGDAARRAAHAAKAAPLRAALAHLERAHALAWEEAQRDEMAAQVAHARRAVAETERAAAAAGEHRA